jgi:hypothetical protein
VTATAAETANVVDVNDRYEFRAEFRDKTGTLSDPASVQLRIEKPDATVLGPFLWPADVTRESLGVFFREHTLDTAGVWTAEWVTTGAPTTAEYERVVAQESRILGEPDEVVATRALVSLEAALEVCDLSLGDVGMYDEVTRHINAVSSRAHLVSGREFVPIAPGSAERQFQIPEGRYGIGYAPSFVRVGDMAADPTAVSVDGTALDATALDAVVSLPRVRAAWAPIRRLRLREAAAYTPGSVVAVTSTWGFPSVPPDVVEAALRQIEFWVKRDHAKYSETFLSSETGSSDRLPDIDRFLMRSVWEAFAAYRDIGISWGVG